MKGPSGEQSSKLSDLQVQFVKYVMNLWHRTSKPPLAPLYWDAQTQFKVDPADRAQGFVFPSITTVWNWLNAISHAVKVIGREGSRHAINSVGAGTTEVSALMFGEKAETDQVYLSIFVNDKGLTDARELDPKEEGEELAPNEIRRVWLHYMLDIATRYPLAWVWKQTMQRIKVIDVPHYETETPSNNIPLSLNIPWWLR